VALAPARPTPQLGFSHFYLECLEDFLPQADIRFWYYDQLGCGFSDSPDDTSL
jgi:proline iminopeptidase